MSPACRSPSSRCPNLATCSRSAPTPSPSPQQPCAQHDHGQPA
jgi:hypothetical protein